MNALRLLLSAASTFVVVGCARHEVQPAEVLPAVEVRTARVQLEVWPVEFPTHGTVRAVQRAAIAAKVAGSIATLSLAIGQAVQAGDVLLTISAVELIARVAQVKAQLAQIERELARERTLESAGAGTLDTVKTLADRLAHGQAALREAETLRDYATVRAPFAGVVTKKFVEVGDFAAPGVPLLQLDGRGAFEIEVGVPESLAAALSVGASLEIAWSDAPTRLRVTVAELSSAAESAARTMTAKLTVPVGAVVHTGQFVSVFLPGPQVATLLVPVNALTLFGQMERVFVVGENNRASLRLVKTGAVNGARVAVVSGLEANERVVVAPVATLRDGQPVLLRP